MRKKILFIAIHRLDRAPCQRFRFEQYFNYLEENGFECTLSPLISEKDDKVFYSKGNYISKFIILLKSFIVRGKDAIAADKYDIIFINREALMTKHIFFERMFARSKAKLVFDFDDSIWIQNVSDANKKLSWLKDASKTSKIIKLCDMVFAGNQYLADYASNFNNNIKIVPTTIDTEEYQKIRVEKDRNKICIGWSGSFSTVEHFKVALPFLEKIKEKYKDKVTFRVIGDNTYVNEELNIKGLAWKKNTEIEDLSFIDIGIMPLPDDEWAKGKCGLKGLQYMALGIPTIMSPVGVNKDIIQDGKNGFLASGNEEWVEKISKLIESAELRNQMGEAGRKTVVENFSIDAQKENYLKFFRELLNKK
jgi:glycosyltransferase involved in cell wall biosynthesis